MIVHIFRKIIIFCDFNKLFSHLFFRIGLCGFDNPMRDQKTDEYKRQVGQVINDYIQLCENVNITRVR